MYIFNCCCPLNKHRRCKRTQTGCTPPVVCRLFETYGKPPHQTGVSEISGVDLTDGLCGFD